MQSRSVVFMLAVLSPSLFCLPYTLQCLQFYTHTHTPARSCQVLMKYHLQRFRSGLPTGINLSGSRTQPTKIIKPKKRQTLINSNMKSNSAAVMSQYGAARTHHTELRRRDGKREQKAPYWNRVNWIPSWNCDRRDVAFGLRSIYIERIPALRVNNRDVGAELRGNVRRVKYRVK